MISLYITLLLVGLHVHVDHSSKTVNHKRRLVVIVKHKIMFFTLLSIIYQICCDLNYYPCEYLTEKRMLTDNNNFSSKDQFKTLPPLSAKESVRFKRWNFN